jgi:GntR family transcriptional regulator
MKRNEGTMTASHVVKPGAKPVASDRARYTQVAAELRKAIESGTYKVGDDLPTEAQLGETHSISRFTAREALRLLTNEGLIQRRQGRGSRVIARSPALRYVVALADESDVLRYIEETTANYKLSKRPVSGTTMQELGAEPSDGWVLLSGVRTVNKTGERIAVSDAYIRSEYAAIFDFDIAEPAVFTRIAEDFGLKISHIDQEISATTLSPGIARRFGREAGDPAMKIVRWFFAQDVGLYEVSSTVHPADLYKHSIRLTRSYPGAVQS